MRDAAPATGRGRHRRPRFGDVEIDAAAREVTIDGEPVSLTRLEFDLLATLGHSRAWCSVAGS